jgi:hypothetical protein
MTPEEQIRQRFRRVAFGLLAIAAVAVTVIDELELMKRRLHVLDRRFWRLVEGEPGFLVVEAAVALLNAMDGPQGRPRASTTPSQHGIDAARRSLRGEATA